MPCYIRLYSGAWFILWWLLGAKVVFVSQAPAEVLLLTTTLACTRTTTRDNRLIAMSVSGLCNVLRFHGWLLPELMARVSHFGHMSDHEIGCQQNSQVAAFHASLPAFLENFLVPDCLLDRTVKLDSVIRRRSSWKTVGNYFDYLYFHLILKD